jgi:hypothetical protein
MKKLFFLALFLLPSAAVWAQAPDCQFSVTFTGAGRQGTAVTPGTTVAAFPALSSPTGTPCVVWHVTYQTIGAVSVNLSFQGVNDNGLMPGSIFTTFGSACPVSNPCTIAIGTNPMADPVQSFLSVIGYFPWVSMLMNTCGGCSATNTVTVKMIGFRAFNAVSASTGTVTISPGSTVGLNAGTNSIGTVGLNPGTNTIGKIDILGNAGGILDSPAGGAAPANALQIAGTDGTNLRVQRMDPCNFLARNYFVVNVTANTQFVAGLAGNNVYICQFFLAPAGAAVSVNIVESSTAGNACATAPVGMMGGATAVLGANLSTSGGFVLPFAGGFAWMKTATVGDSVCIFANGQVNGVISWVQNNP